MFGQKIFGKYSDMLPQVTTEEKRRHRQRFVLRKKVRKTEKTLAEKYLQRTKGETVKITVEVSADAIMRFFEKNLKQTIENALK